jgi:hypothetical protein
MTIPSNVETSCALQDIVTGSQTLTLRKEES